MRGVDLSRGSVGGVLAPILAVTLAACGPGAPQADNTQSPAGAGFPVQVSSCGHTSELPAKPTKAVTLNQGATEVALALGVQDQLAGTAYLDDTIPAKWKSAYDSIPVLSKEYPSREKLLAVAPDFVYASYSSGFEEKVAGTQHELAQRAIASYLSPFGCADQAERSETSWEAVSDEVDEVAKAFGVSDRAAEIRQRQQRKLADLEAAGEGRDVKVVWYDSNTKAPFVGAGEGGPQLILDAVGATNVFADLPGGWADGSWEKVVAADPDVIVLADASWDTAADKIAYLRQDPVLSRLRAVQDNAIVTVPFSESTPGVRLIDGATHLSEQLAALDAE